MSTYSPPRVVTDIFNDLDYQSQYDSITLFDADKRYLKTTGGNLTGMLYCNNGLTASSIFSTGTCDVGELKIAGDTVDFSYISDITPGTITPLKAVVVDANRDILNFRNIDSSGTITCHGIALNGNINLTGSNTSINSTTTWTGGSVPSIGNGMFARFSGMLSTGMLNSYNTMTSSQNNLSLNNDALYIKSNGNIGIATNNPSYPLDVIGDINTSTGYRVAGTEYDVTLIGYQTGFQNSTDSTMSYNSTTRIFTIQPVSSNYKVWVNGKRYTKTIAESTTAHATTTGAIYFIHFNSSGVLTISTTFPDYQTNAWCALLYYYDATHYMLLNERHTILISPKTHSIVHNALGTELLQPSTLSNLSVLSGGTNPTSDADNTWSSSTSQIADEDITTNISAVPVGGPYVCMYLTGTGLWTWQTSSLPYIFTPASYINYNQFTTSWQLTNVAVNNRWITTYVLLVPSLDTSLQTVIITGQTAYTTLASAQQESFANLSLGNFPFQEFVVTQQVIWRSAGYVTSGKVRCESLVRITDSRMSTVSGAPSSHQALSNLQLAGPGSTYGHIDDQTQSISGIKTFSDGIGGTLQTASQPNITSLGTLTGLSLSNNSTNCVWSCQPGFCHIGTTNNNDVCINRNGTLVAKFNATGLRLGDSSNASTALDVVGTVTASTGFSGTVLTASQPNITSLGTLTGLSITKSGNDALILTNPSSTSLSNIKFVGDASTWEVGIRNSSATDPKNGLYMYNGQFRFVITSSGQCGIGTVSPTSSYLLDVAGNARVGGNILATGTYNGTSITGSSFIASDSSTLSTASDSSFLSSYSIQCRIASDTGGVQNGIGFLVASTASNATTPHASIRVRRAGTGFWGSTVYISAKPSSGSTQTSNVVDILSINGDGGITHNAQNSTFAFTQNSTASPAFIYQTTTQNNATALLCQTSGNSVAVSVAGDGAHIGAGGASSSLFLECNAVSYWKIDSTAGYFMPSYQPQNARIGVQTLLGDLPLCPIHVGHSTVADKIIAVYWAPVSNVAGGEDFYGIGANSSTLELQGKQVGLYSNAKGNALGDACLVAHTANSKGVCSIGTLAGTTASDFNILRTTAGIRLGKAESLHNSFTIQYNHVGDGNTQNYISFDEYGSSKQFVISSNWGCGIGDTPSNFKALMHLNGSVSYTVNYKKYDISSNSYSTVSGSSIDLSLYCSSNAFFNTSVATASDERYKTNIMDYDITESDYLKLKPKRYLKHGSNWEIGLIAQDVVRDIENHPDIVSPVPDKSMKKRNEYDPEDDFAWSIQYDRLALMNMNMVQKNVNKINELESQIEDLKIENMGLKSEIDNIYRLLDPIIYDRREGNCVSNDLHFGERDEFYEL
jgi:hypothetical protein